MAKVVPFNSGTDSVLQLKTPRLPLENFSPPGAVKAGPGPEIPLPGIEEVETVWERLQKLENLPNRLYELIPGKAWSGPHSPLTEERLWAKKEEYRRSGILEGFSTGLDKGSLFLIGPDGNYYELVLWERRAAILHHGTPFEWQSLVRDLGLQKIQLDRESKLFFDLPGPALDYLANQPVVGESGSNAPPFNLVTARLTLSGPSNPDPSLVGKPLTRTLDRNGQEGILPEISGLEGEDTRAARYLNGHNLPRATLEYFQNQLKDSWPELVGLPLSDPYWLEVTAAGRPQWLLWQAFERGTITYTPSNPPAFKVEGGLVGNFLVAALQKGKAELYPAQNKAEIFEPRGGSARPPFQDAVGWAYSALVERDSAGKLDDMRWMKEQGLNTLYIGHANPARFPYANGPEGVEPGLSHSLYYSLTNPSAYKAAARETLSVLFQTLDAARGAGLKVVLPINYQVQMGDEWNARHEAALRKKGNGEWLSHFGDPGTRTASPYAAEYQAEIMKYYQWVNETIVQKYPEVITALNLADEPMGTDYSLNSKKEFARVYGLDYDYAPSWLQGRFHSGFVANYAAWSARAWEIINPDLWTMMTHHIERSAPWFPDLEKIFAQTPASYIFSADTHWHDAPPKDPYTLTEFLQLLLVLRTLGWLSSVYDRSLMPWAGVNAWSLGYSADVVRQGRPYGGIKEALESLEAVHREIKRLGGRISMLMAWGFNIRNQTTPFLPETIARVTTRLADLKEGLSNLPPGGGAPDLILAYNPQTISTRLINQKLDLFVPVVNLQTAIRGAGKDFEEVMRAKSVILPKGGRAYLKALALNPGPEVVELF